MKKSPHEIVQRTCGRDTSIGSFEFADGSTLWRARTATVNSKAANDETANTWRVAA